MPQSEVNDYIEISDFTAGIHSGYNSQTGFHGNITEPAADGTAQVTGTWGCVGLPNGGLAGLPRLGEIYNLVLSDATDRPEYYSNGSPYIYILDILNFPGVRPPDYIEDIGPVVRAHPVTLDRNSAGINDFLTMILQRYYNPTGSGGTYWSRQWAAYFHNLSIDPAMSGINVEYGAASPYHLPQMDWIGDYDDAFVLGSADYGFGCIDIGRVNDNTPTHPGQPGFRFGIGGRLNIAEEENGTDTYNRKTVYHYPSSVGHGAPYKIIDDVSPCIVMSHQGRIVWADASFGGLLPGPATAFGANWVIDKLGAGGIHTSEELYWTKVNDVVVDNSTGTVFVEENPVGLGAWASMNASELFLVKHHGGAVVVRGSLNNPTVVRLPGVESTYGVVCHPVITPLGCIYGTRTGVWVWNGSDTAECLSPNIDGFFWEPNHTLTQDLHPAQSMGRFGYHYPYVFAPNNWVMDVRTKGWFRLSNTDDTTTIPIFAHYNASMSDRMFASPIAIPVPDDGEDFDVPYLYTYDINLTATDWAWVSQPLQKTRNRRIDFRELSFVAQGTGTMTFTLRGLSDDEVVTITHEIDSLTRPIAITYPLSISAHDVVLEITSTASEDFDHDGAPTLYRISLGHRPAMGVTSEGSVGGNG